MKGMFAWVGSDQVTIDYQRDARFAGETAELLAAVEPGARGHHLRSARRRLLASFVGLATAIY